MFAGEYNTEVRPGEVFPIRANVAFAIKERNGGKLNSHVWAFRGLIPYLNPRYVVLLDAGTVPAPTAILRLFCDMEYDDDIGGCCGEIMVDRCQLSFTNPIVMAQVCDLIVSVMQVCLIVSCCLFLLAALRVHHGQVSNAPRSDATA